jgi:hypothetical protein
MNTLKTVFGKLFKEETQLAKHEVELALVNEIENLSNQVQKITTDFDSQIKIFEKEKLALRNIIKGRTQQSIDLLTKIKDAQKMSNDLGMKFDDSKYKKILESYYKLTDKIDSLLQ